MEKYNKSIGNLGEDKACGYLSRRGYEIIERNVNFRGGELDIIAKKNDELVFVEVKTRTGTDFGEAYEAVTQAKINHIIHSANMYIHKKNLYDIPVRFDVMEVYIDTSKRFFNTRINHIKNAF
ncbi:MAG: YraN family protein [Clostridia bacterium]|nr:YraN family protein [Clostridia bacterium]